MLRALAQNALSDADVAAAVNATHGFPLAVSLLARLIGTGDATTLTELLTRPLYMMFLGASEIPESKILTSVAPRIVMATEALVEQLKKHPESVYYLHPRKFEELLAELLADMGWRVELTPASFGLAARISSRITTLTFWNCLCLVEAKDTGAIERWASISSATLWNVV